MKKGFIFTTDIIIAVITALIFITIAFGYISNTQAINWNKPALSQFAQDSLTILERNDDLGRDMRANSNASIQIFLNNLPSNLCGRIVLYNITYSSNSLYAMNATKKNCKEPTQRAVARRNFVILRKILSRTTASYHQAKMELWYA